MANSKAGFVTHKKDNLLYVRGKLPQGGVRAQMDEWASQGYTSSCHELAKKFNCSFVAGSVSAINEARAKLNLPPIKY